MSTGKDAVRVSMAADTYEFRIAMGNRVVTVEISGEAATDAMQRGTVECFRVMALAVHEALKLAGVGVVIGAEP